MAIAAEDFPKVKLSSKQLNTLQVVILNYDETVKGKLQKMLLEIRLYGSDVSNGKIKVLGGTKAVTV